MMRSFKLLSRWVLLMGSCLLVNSLFAASGAELFASQCSRCHHDINRLSSSPEQVKTILQQQSIKQHQFTLSDEDIKLIVSYFEASRK